MRKFLNEELENWLFTNYPYMTNQQLADELTKKVTAVNQKEVKRLNDILCNIKIPTIEKTVKMHIANLLMFKGISSDYVRKYASKIGCQRKTIALRTESARKKAASTNIKRWLTKAERVEVPMDWFRTFYNNETRICLVKNAKEVKSIRTAMSRWNRLEGFDRGIFLSSSYVEEANILKVQATINRATDIS